MDNEALARLRLDLRRVYTEWRPRRDDELIDDILRRLDRMCVEITTTIDADQFALPLEEV